MFIMFYLFLYYGGLVDEEEMECDECAKVLFVIVVLGGVIMIYIDVVYCWFEFWDWYIGMLGFGDKVL